MAGYRQIHSRMWSSDQWFADLSAELKLLFIYLFSNERASVSGLYELPVRVIAFETGLSAETIKAGLVQFADADKVLYDFEKSVVWVRKMLKYQGSASPKVKNRVKADVASVPDCALKTRWLSEYTVSVEYGYSIEESGYSSDTSSSISISSYSSEEGGGVGEGTTVNEPPIPETVREAMEHPDIQLYKQITNGFPGDKNYRPIVEAIQHLRKTHGSNLTEYLMPYWTAWSTRKTKEGKPYSPASLVWLCEWAMQGSMPSANGHEPKQGQNWTPIPDVEKTRQMLAERDKQLQTTATGKSIAELAGKMGKKK